MKKLNKKGVFGLNAIQTFFATILGIALLAYVIVVIMGVLSGTTIIPQADGQTVTIANESVIPTDAGVALTANTYRGCSATIIGIINASDTKVIELGNISTTGCIVKNTSSSYANIAGWRVTYSYTKNSVGTNNLNSILGNTSQGVTGFFSAINPVYAILAVLVIILVLVVLVRVVQAPNQSGSSPQL